MNGRDMHDRLDSAITAYPPRPAPVDAVVRRGGRIRWRRRAVVTVTVAAGVAAAILIPRAASVRAVPPSAPPAHGGHTVTVAPPGPHSPAGEIAQGTIDGQTWLLLAGAGHGGSRTCLTVTGSLFGRSSGSCGFARPYGVPAEFVATAAVGGEMPDQAGDVAQLLKGTVAPDVTDVTVTLTNSATLVLHPVRVQGTRYIAFAVPPQFVSQVTAYSRSGEIAHATPFDGSQGYMFFDWLRPGQRGMQRQSVLVGSGRFGGTSWSVRLEAGPWGICSIFVDSAGGGPGGCWPGPLASIPGTTMSAETVSATTMALGVATPDVTRIVVTLPPGRTVPVRLVVLAGQKYWAFGYPSRVPWSAYNAAGHVIARGNT